MKQFRIVDRARRLVGTIWALDYVEACLTASLRYPWLKGGQVMED
jgi:hypothetical protein